MKLKSPLLLLTIALIILAGCIGSPAPTTTPTPPTPTSQPAPAKAEPSALPSASPLPSAVQTLPSRESPAPPPDPFTLISQERLFAFLEDLTAIQPYSGWRTSSSQGEAEALDYVTEQLGDLEYLQKLGLERERQRFHVFLGTELWETRLHLMVNGKETEVPADGLRGPRDDPAQALRFDSDGAFNDSNRDPVVVEGAAVIIRSADEIHTLRHDAVQGKVVFVDYAVIDRVLRDTPQAASLATELLSKEPAGLVLVTTFSNQPGESHGSFVGDSSALTWVETEWTPPTLYVRLEDLALAGIADWGDMERVENARLTWDADVFCPADSGNLVARIPGADPSRAIILSAHIDSPNSPGALDDGSGSVVLLEVAYILDAAQIQPPADLYLVWFGSEELGLYGSSHFVATHQELLDRTTAMLQIDCLTRPLDGIAADLMLVTWSYGRLGDSRLLWPDYLAEIAARRGIEVITQNHYFVYSDNNTFAGFDVPHADLIYENGQAMRAAGGIHYASHIHDPYDTIDLARDVGGILEQMARLALASALEPPQDVFALRATPRPDRRAVFVGSHTEAVHMTPAVFTELGMALAMEGFDVDLIPYGETVNAASLVSADLVIVPPVVDYPSPEVDPDLYDEAWSNDEIAALEAYVAEGGLLVLTNSLHRLKFGTQGLDPNEDWGDANALASRFGVTFETGAVSDYRAQVKGDSPLVDGLSTLELGRGNGTPFSLLEGIEAQVLARAAGEPVVTLLNYGHAGGQVLVLADISILTSGYGQPQNLAFWRNLAAYARSR